MRLLHTSSLKLREFIGGVHQRYAILSHTWGEEEILFEDITNGIASSKKGYGKVKGCCAKAAKDGFEWVWIDTCCIDKTSSAELSEAINSMYKWYQQASICYVYLADVLAEHVHADGIANSRWFTRGWTLQELIAPRLVEFYTSEWAEIGTKSSLASRLSQITGIREEVLRGADPSKCCVAERMSWAAQRRTTRTEDTAYSLMGLFNVNMPLLYGEGRKAFIRLQEQILAQEEDYSLLGWASPWVSKSCCLTDSPTSYSGFHSALSRLQLSETADDSKVYDFTRTTSSQLKYNLVRHEDIHKLPPHISPREPPTVTSRGLRLSLPVLRVKGSGELATNIGWIYCGYGDQLLCVLLQRPTTESRGQWTRQASRNVFEVDASLLAHFVLEDVLLETDRRAFEGVIGRYFNSMQPTEYVRIGIQPNQNISMRVVAAFPHSLWDPNRSGFTFKMTLGSSVAGIIICEYTHDKKGCQFEVLCGIHPGSYGQAVHRWCSIGKQSHMQIEELAIEGGDAFMATNVGELEAMNLDSWESFPLRLDRTATRSAQEPSMVLAASVRELLPGVSTLCVTACHENQCEPWMRVQLQNNDRA